MAQTNGYCAWMSRFQEAVIECRQNYIHEFSLNFSTFAALHFIHQIVVAVKEQHVFRLPCKVEISHCE